MQIEQDFTGQPSRVRLALRVQLVDVRDAAPAGQPNAAPGAGRGRVTIAAGGVAAANALLQRAVVERRSSAGA